MAAEVPSRLVVLDDGESRALIYPEQGFQLHGFAVSLGGTRRVEVVYGQGGRPEPADRRHGNPVLFPACGASNGSQPDSWDHGGHALLMPQHGWARVVCWQVVAQDARSVSAVLVPTNWMKLVYPFDFELRLTYTLEGRALALTSVLTNRGSEPFPYALGFHPYLRAPIVENAARSGCKLALPAGVQLSSPDGWRTVERAPVPARTLAVDDARLPGSIVLADTGARALEVLDERAKVATSVSIEGSEETFPVWVAWTAAPDARYVCLEPWTDAPNALNRPGTRTIAPGAVHRYRMSIATRSL
jgi:galactose mutarotase-like enzyme